MNPIEKRYMIISYTAALQILLGYSQKYTYEVLEAPVVLDSQQRHA